MKITGQRIVLTGAASGIGRSLLRLFSVYPVQIVCADMQSEILEQTVSELSGSPSRLIAFTGDLSQPMTVDDLFAFAQVQMGGIDIFIANAGYAHYEVLNHADWERIAHLQAVNVTSPIYSAAKMHGLYPHGNYTVVLIASAMSYIAVPGYSVYAATKAAIDRFAEGHRYEIPLSARLMVVYPVGTKTSFFKGAGKDVPALPPLQTSDEVARAIIHGMEHDRKKIFPHPLFRWMRFSAITLELMRFTTRLIGNRQFRAWRARQKSV